MALVPETNPATILVVEDDDSVRKVVGRIVSNGGFHLLSAGSGEEALNIEKEFRGTIELLISDVMMPDMSGPEVAQKMKLLRPGMRVMLMSGYPDGALSVLNFGWHFIRKPFMAADLTTRIKDVLECGTA